MSVQNQFLAFIGLGGWFALWWLAVRIVFGSRFGPFEWVPVAICACCVPMIAADLCATLRGGPGDGWILAAWGSVALSIDGAWTVSRLIRWKRRQGSERT